jgi:hypothetical protein
MEPGAARTLCRSGRLGDRDGCGRDADQRRLDWPDPDERWRKEGKKARRVEHPQPQNRRPVRVRSRAAAAPWHAGLLLEKIPCMPRKIVAHVLYAIEN